jgi:hypothetical protein
MSALGLVASYKRQRGQFNKNKIKNTDVNLNNFISSEEIATLLHNKNMSGFVANCDFAIEQLKK